MTARIIVLMMFIGIETFAIADNKGFCPPTPPKTAASPTKASAQQTPPSPGAEYVGSVLLMVVVSDKGYVCDAQVIRGLDKETNKRAIANIHQRHFEPARKDNHAIPAVVALEVGYWRKDGELIQSPDAPPKQPQNSSRH